MCANLVAVICQNTLKSMTTRKQNLSLWRRIQKYKIAHSVYSCIDPHVRTYTHAHIFLYHVCAFKLLNCDLIKIPRFTRIKQSEFSFDLTSFIYSIKIYYLFRFKVYHLSVAFAAVLLNWDLNQTASFIKRWEKQRITSVFHGPLLESVYQIYSQGVGRAGIILEDTCLSFSTVGYDTILLASKLVTTYSFFFSFYFSHLTASMQDHYFQSNKSTPRCYL